MKNGYITILDIGNDETHIFQIFIRDGVTIEDFLIHKGFDPKKVHYMFTDTIKLKIH